MSESSDRKTEATAMSLAHHADIRGGTTFEEREKFAEEIKAALKAQRQIMSRDIFARPGAMTCVSDASGPHVRFSFPTLEAAQRFYEDMVNLSVMR